MALLSVFVVLDPVLIAANCLTSLDHRSWYLLQMVKNNCCKGLRKMQHTPGTYPRPSTTFFEGNPFICILGYLGYVPGVCWNFLRGILSTTGILHDCFLLTLDETTKGILRDATYQAINSQLLGQATNRNHPKFLWKKETARPLWDETTKLEDECFSQKKYVNFPRNIVTEDVCGKSYVTDLKYWCFGGDPKMFGLSWGFTMELNIFYYISSSTILTLIDFTISLWVVLMFLLLLLLLCCIIVVLLLVILLYMIYLKYLEYHHTYRAPTTRHTSTLLIMIHQGKPPSIALLQVDKLY